MRTPALESSYPMTMIRASIVCLLLATSVSAARPVASTCGLKGDYEEALCAYQSRRFADAEQKFRAIVDKDEPAPRTIRATYFLARTLMKTGRYEEASRLLIRIYGMDKPFYDGWNCDFLLGECRRALGQS
jgi:TolA-binding protein